MKESEREKLLAAHGNRCVATETVCRAAGAKLPGAIFARAIDDNLRTSETAWKAWLESGSREDISNEIERINVPVLVVTGEKDETMTAKLLKREIVRCVRNVNLIVLAEVKHLLPLEAPEKIAELIRVEIEKLVLGINRRPRNNQPLKQKPMRVLRRADDATKEK